MLQQKQGWNLGRTMADSPTAVRLSVNSGLRWGLRQTMQDWHSQTSFFMVYIVCTNFTADLENRANLADFFWDV